MGTSSRTELGTAMVTERGTAPTILIVDDEDSTRNLCRDVINDSGLRTRTASTTEQALEILDQWPVEILITDLRVPQLGGLELLKRVRRDFPQTAVLVLTQYGTIESAVEATRLGAADYITKPFHIPELRTKIDRMIRSPNPSVRTRAVARPCSRHLRWTRLGRAMARCWSSQRLLAQTW